MTSRPFAATASALAAVALLPAAAAAQDEPSGREQPPKVSLLFALDARSGSLTPTGDGTYRLTLRHPSAQTTVFSDRPYRFATTVGTRAFVRDFDAMFGADAPNTALDLVEADGKGNDLVVLTISRARRHGDAVSFDARIIEPTGRLAEQRHRVQTTPPRHFGHAALFVDDFLDFLKSAVPIAANIAQTVAPALLTLA